MLKFQSLYDGHLDISQRNLFGESAEDLKLKLPIHSFLLELDGNLILVDTGCGSYFGPGAGKLPKSFAVAGYRPEDVTLILCTHLHPDHIGGLPLFSKATVAVSSKEADYWLNDESVLTPSNQKYLPFVREIMASCEGRILIFEPGEMLLPGIQPIAAYGHTPGHTAFLCSSKEENLLLWGDLIHNVDLQFPNLERAVKFDEDPKKAVESRKKFIEKAITENLIVGGAHLPGSALGRISKTDNRLNYYPF